MTLPNPQTEQEAEQKIVNIDNKQYLFNSLDEESKNAFTQAIEINDKIGAKKLEIRDLTYAVQYLVNFLLSRTGTFTEVTPEYEEEKEEKEEKAIR